MATKVGTLLVEMKAETATLRRDIGTMRGDLNRFASRANASLKQVDSGFTRLARGAGILRGAFAALGVSLGAAGLVSGFRSTLEMADRIGKTADKVGLTTDALQELRFAATQAGVKTDTLDMAMQRFSRRVGEAAKGTGELKPTLDAYGIAVTDADGRTRSLDAVLGDLANAIQGAGSAQERLTIGFKAFDSEGAALVNMLKDGDAGLRRVRDAARDAGAVMDADLIRRAEEAANRFDRLGTSIRVSFGSAMLELIPLMEAFAARFESVASAAARGFRTLFADPATLSLEDLKVKFDNLIATIGFLKGLNPDAPGVRALLEQVTKAAQATEEQMKRLKESTRAAGVFEAPQPRALPPEFKVQRGPASDLDAFIKKIGGAREETDNLKRSMEDLTRVVGTAFEDAILEGKKFGDVLKGLAQDMLRVALRATVTQPLQSALAGGLSSLFGGFGFRAEGGPVSAGRSYIVGEKGPELFTAPSPGAIIPNSALAGGGAGGNVTVNLNIQTGVAQTVRAEMMSLMPAIRDSVAAAVADRARRGGRFSEAFG